MKAVPTSVPAKERWTLIANMVCGKTPKECFMRFKTILAKVKAKGKDKK